MTARKVVGVDMDDTIFDLINKCIYYHNHKYPDHLVKYQDVISWKFDGIWHPDCTEQECFGRPGLYRELELIDDYVVGELKRIHDQHDLIIITAAWPTAVLEKWESLQEHFPFIPVENFCPWKRKDKVEYDLLIDDAVHNLIPAIERGRKAIGITHPWNTSIRDRLPFRTGWEGMSDFVNQILEV